MKIVTWNCNGALRKKTEVLDMLEADVYVIQECEDPAQSTDAFRDWAGSYLWVGTSKHKGLGVFPKKGNSVRALDWLGAFSQPGVSNSSAASSWMTTDLKLFTPFVLNEEFQVLEVLAGSPNSTSQRQNYLAWRLQQQSNLGQARSLVEPLRCC
jgi:exonuclease III